VSEGFFSLNEGFFSLNDFWQIEFPEVITANIEQAAKQSYYFCCRKKFTLIAMKLKVVPENLLERIALRLNLAPMPLVDTQVAFNSARAIMAGAETGVYQALGKNEKTAEQVAKECNTNAVATKQLLDCLVGIGYLTWNDGKYALKKKYYKWLLKEYPSNLLGKLKFQATEWNWMAYLEDYVRTGKPLDLHSVLSPDEWISYQDGMRDLSINSAKELSGKLKLTGSARHMLDIGGSHGLYSIEMCRKNPNLSSTILELPGAVDRASAIAAQYGFAERVKYKTGNALTDDLGESLYDLVMINNVVHHFTNEQNIHVTEKVKRALKPGGIFAIGEFIRQSRPGAGGVVAATCDMYFSLTSSSGTWSADEMKAWQKQAGLKPMKAISLMTLPGWKVLPAVK
jgi:2-polyprenyl-3-methyl-5-hydroxy-6-metoxy-1,4-benzoquinol methylase